MFHGSRLMKLMAQGQQGRLGAGARGLIRVNPSQVECDEMQRPNEKQNRYCPLVATSGVALEAVVESLGLGGA